MINLKKVIIPILVLVAAGAGWYFYKGQGALPGVGSSLKSEAFKGGLAAAVKLGVPMKCSYSIGNEMESEGYIKGKNYRGKMEDETGKVSEVIMKDNCMWNWDTETREGSKFCFEGENEDAMWDFDAGDTEDMDIPEGYEAPDVEYDCKPAVISDSMFALPTDVKFLDMQEMMNSFMPEGMEAVDGFEGESTNLDDWK